MSHVTVAHKTNSGATQLTPQPCHNQLWLKISLVVLGILLIGGCIASHLYQVNSIAVYSMGSVGGILVLWASIALLVQYCRQQKEAKAEGMAIEDLSKLTPDQWKILAQDGDAKAIQRGLESGFIKDPTYLLARAARYGHVEVVDLVLARGVPKSEEILNESPLHRAAEGFCETEGLAIMEKLLAWEPMLVSTKDILLRTPLHIAAICGHKKQVELLLAHKAEVNAIDRDGRTPLRCHTFDISKKPDIELIETLVRAGSRLDIADKSGDTPLGWAQKFHSEWFNDPAIQPRLKALTTATSTT